MYTAIFHHTFPSPASLVEGRGGRSRGGERLYIMLPHAKPSRDQGRVRARRTAERSRPCQNGGNIGNADLITERPKYPDPKQYITFFFLVIGRPSGFLRRLEKNFLDGSGTDAGSEPLC